MKRENLKQANDLVKRLEFLEGKQNALSKIALSEKEVSWKLHHGGYSCQIPDCMTEALKIYAEKILREEISELETLLEGLK